MPVFYTVYTKHQVRTTTHRYSIRYTQNTKLGQTSYPSPGTHCKNIKLTFTNNYIFNVRTTSSKPNYITQNVLVYHMFSALQYNRICIGKRRLCIPETPPSTGRICMLRSASLECGDQVHEIFELVV